MEWFVHFGEQINNSGADALMAFNFAFSAAVLGVGDEMIFDRDAITQPAWRAGGQRRTRETAVPPGCTDPRWCCRHRMSVTGGAGQTLGCLFAGRLSADATGTAAKPGRRAAGP